jgi:signal transduction histidine kinase
MARQLFGPIGNDQYLNYAADIQKSGQHLLALINDILSISRLDVGKTDLNDDADIDLQTLIENCLRWVSGRALEAGVELDSTVAPETPGLRADSRLLTQVLLNLLSNAVKFTPRGGKVQLDVGVAGNGGIEIAVRDTGIGMSPDEVANIGVPFLQFDNGLARKFEGTGLGLSIAKRLIELHGGRLEVQSVPNKGTEMRVLLPPERTVWREGAIARKSAALSMQAT